MHKKLSYLFAVTMAFAAISAATAAERTTPVEVKNTPSVTVTNTPDVAVTNSPTVKIDSTNNVVQAATKNNTVQLWTSNQVISGNSGLNTIASTAIDCTGYKEIRVALFSDVTSVSLQVKISFGTSFSNSYKALGFANFATPSATVTNLGNFQSFGGNNNYCYFSHPVISNTCFIIIMNHTNSPVIMSKDSWVYLVN